MEEENRGWMAGRLYEKGCKLGKGLLLDKGSVGVVGWEYKEEKHE